MAKKRVVRKHTVKAAIDNIDLTRAGSSITLEVYAADEKIGTVVLGRGTLNWYGKHRRVPTTVSWTNFADWMEGH
jgi:hypothetical protein